MMHEEHQGGCLCTAVRYQIRGAPLYSVICHCRTCRRASASSQVAWLTYERRNFLILAGTPQTFRSSSRVLRTFCAACGTPLTYATERSPDHIDVTTVSLDDPSLFPPTREVWTAERLDWSVLNPQLENLPQGS